MASVTFGNGQPWELGEQIGAGGAGQVYLATNGASEPQVVKLVPKGVPGAQREIFVNRGLQSRTNVVPVLDTGKTDTHLALLMPKAQMSLRQYMGRTPGPMSEADALPILTDIARGLVSLGGAQVPGEAAPGIVHRDLKPENVLFLNGAWCISDFGIARYLSKGTALDTRRYFMTHAYAAPEQWRGETATPETDVYALGVIAFEILMGRLPFGGPDFRQQHLNSTAPSIGAVSLALATIVTECLYKPMGARPSPDALMRRLEREESRMGSIPAAPLTPGVAALQSASVSDTAQSGQAKWRAQQARELAEQRARLFSVATEQWTRIGDLLRNTIVENAPTCRPLESDGGWQLQLGKASIAFSQCRQSTPWTDPHPIIGSDPPKYKLPFDVIADCYIAVGKSVHDLLPESGTNYSGHAHSLWFCDAQIKGQYAWHEVAFSSDRPFDTMGDPNLGYNGYFWTRSNTMRKLYTPPGHYLPIAGLPGDVAGSSVLRPGETVAITNFNVAWPFTPLLMGELDDFLDRWVTWFAKASVGKLARPSAKVASTPRGSWRTSDQPKPPKAPAQSKAVNQPKPAEPPRSKHHGQVEAILQELEHQSGYEGFGAVAIAPGLPIAECEAMCRELRVRLRVEQLPALILRRQSDKKGRSPIGDSSGAISQLLTRRQLLRFLDGTPYEEFVFASVQDWRMALVERREPTKRDQKGRLLCAFLVASSERGGVFPLGRPSPALRSWLDGPEMILVRQDTARTSSAGPYTAERAHRYFDALMDKQWDE